jgi:predicted nucleotidyltransferase
METSRQVHLNQIVKQMLTTLITQYQPEKIILFGSLATDTVTQWSDIDLVIIKETSKPFLARLKEVALLCYAPVGVDFLVYTPTEFEQMIAERNPFIIDEIIQNGKLLYDYTTPTMA